MAEYEGWSNWATWNAALWCNNEEPVYKAFMRLVRRGICDAKTCKDEFFAWFPNGTPDMDVGKDIFDIDWEEFAEAMNEE